MQGEEDKNAFSKEKERIEKEFKLRMGLAITSYIKKKKGLKNNLC